jgi:pimeloyl-ACP methyl ester carboxylesterase
VLAGRYDPITPPAYGELAAATLSDSHVFTFPGIGHWTLLVHQCPLTITLAFLRSPSARPDAGCIARMNGPEWKT